MSRLTLKYFDIFIAAAKLSGVANSFGSLMFEWPCRPTTILCLSAIGAIRFATVIVRRGRHDLVPSAFVISKPRSISASVKLSFML